MPHVLARTGAGSLYDVAILMLHPSYKMPSRSAVCLTLMLVWPMAPSAMAAEPAMDDRWKEGAQADAAFDAPRVHAVAGRAGADGAAASGEATVEPGGQGSGDGEASDDAPVDEAGADDEPAATATGEVPVEEVSIEEASIERASNEGASGEETAVGEAVVEEHPLERVSGEVVHDEKAHGEKAPEQEASGEETSGEDVIDADSPPGSAAESAPVQDEGATGQEAQEEGETEGREADPEKVQEEDREEAREEGEEEESGEESEPGIVLQALEGGQEVMTRAVVGLSRRMDRMLGAREVYPDEVYDSLLRVRFIQRLDDSGGSGFEPEASGRISLPGAQRRWSVIFLSDDFDDPLDRERRTDRELDETTRRSIALRYLKPLEGWQTSLSVGLRSGEPVDLLTRGRVWRDFRAGALNIRPGQSVFWYDERGLGATTELRFEYPLDIMRLLRSDSSATWFRRDERVYYDQVLSLLHSLGPRRALLWQLGMQAESEPNHHVTRYYAQMRWRSVVHRDWLILELRPQLIRERENSFHVERRLYFGFEILFGDPTR